MLKDQYVVMYILSMYSQPTNTGQIHNVLVGRTTPTILYLVEVKSWHGYFGLFNKLDRDKLNQLHGLFMKKKLIEPSQEIEGKYKLTSYGSQTVNNYLKDEDRIKSNQFYSSDYRTYVWDVFQLMTQIVSEKTSENRHFSPITTNPMIQSEVKVFLKHSDFSQDLWIKETIQLFNKLNQSDSDLLANLLVGNGIMGSTDKQIQTHLNLSEGAYYIAQQRAIQSLINHIDAECGVLNLLLKMCESRSNYRLSPSTFETAKLLYKGLSIEQVASLRRIKINTIHEHIIEMAFIWSDFDYSACMPANVYDQLDSLYETGEYSFKRAKETIDSLLFMHFRLYELERMREDND